MLMKKGRGRRGPGPLSYLLQPHKRARLNKDAPVSIVTNEREFSAACGASYDSPWLKLPGVSRHRKRRTIPCPPVQQLPEGELPYPDIKLRPHRPNGYLVADATASIKECNRVRYDITVEDCEFLASLGNDPTDPSTAEGQEEAVSSNEGEKKKPITEDDLIKVIESLDELTHRMATSGRPAAPVPPAAASTDLVSFKQAREYIRRLVPGLGSLDEENLLTLYEYWVRRREKLKRPLCRCFWHDTSTGKTNFGPRPPIANMKLRSGHMKWCLTQRQWNNLGLRSTDAKSERGTRSAPIASGGNPLGKKFGMRRKWRGEEGRCQC